MKADVTHKHTFPFFERLMMLNPFIFMGFAMQDAFKEHLAKKENQNKKAKK